MNTNKLIEKLIQQHETLLKIIVKINGMSKDPNPSFANIELELKDFSKLLVEHVYLENSFVYKNIHESERNDLASVTSAKLFFEEMENIVKDVVKFLNKYNSGGKVESDFQNFKENFKAVGQALSTRIKLEENFLYKFL